MKKMIACATVIFTLTIPLLSTATAYDEGLSSVPLSGMTTAVSKTRADILIQELNRECERIEANNSFEEIDLLTERAIDIVLSTMEMRDTEGLSEMEVDEYVKSRFELIDILDKYTQTLPKGDRKILFQNAQEYAKSLMTFD